MSTMFDVRTRMPSSASAFEAWSRVLVVGQLHRAPSLLLLHDLIQRRHCRIGGGSIGSAADPYARRSCAQRASGKGRAAAGTAPVRAAPGPGGASPRSRTTTAPAKSGWSRRPDDRTPTASPGRGLTAPDEEHLYRLLRYCGRRPDLGPQGGSVVLIPQSISLSNAPAQRIHE